MEQRRHRRAALTAAVVGTAILYFTWLGRTTPYLSIEEVGAARQALSLAATGRSLSGQFLPLYIGEPQFEAGRDPIWIYIEAGLLKVFPFSETLVRMLSALTGVVNVALMFVLARRLFGSDSAAAAAAAILALTPAHFFESRISTSQIGSLPFVLGWLILLDRFVETRRPRTLFWACAVLGLGIYAHLTALVMTPIYFLATLVAVVRLGGDVRPAITMAMAGYAVGFAPYLLWTVAHPERIAQLLTYYSDNGYNPDLAQRNFSLVKAVIARLDVWWNTFNPERAFFIGDSNYRLSTRQAGYLLIAAAPFLVVGLANLRRILSPTMTFIVAVGLLAGPIPAVAAGDFEIKRYLPMLLFVTIATAGGVVVAWRSRRLFARAAVAAGACAAAVQFAVFLHDYHGDYRARSRFAFGSNQRGAIQQVLADTHDLSCVFFDYRTALDRYWVMYARAYGHADVADTSILVDAESPGFAPPPRCGDAALVVFEKELRNRAGFSARLQADGWRGTTVPEPDGVVVLRVFHWQRGGTQ